ncbi:MAG: response regulator transcription factor [Deltaproteobacteria bacterium]|jgi:DNA-binding NarL/FixJ family response regulator|nr:response regulator transcription factor [Deltaproteobacteria bacterium]
MHPDEISKVFIADDHPLFRCGLRLSLNQKENIEVIGEADDGFKAVEKILSGHPDIALIDVDMPGLSGIGAVRMLRKAMPELKILVLSAHDDDRYVRDSMSAGADGYVLKSIDVDALIRIIELFCKGEPVLSPYLLNLAVDCSVAGKTDSHHPSLTSREKEVLKYLVEGQANKKIADNLFISLETVKSHIKHIFRKLDVTNRVEAVRVTTEQELLDF